MLHPQVRWRRDKVTSSKVGAVQLGGGGGRTMGGTEPWAPPAAFWPGPGSVVRAQAEPPRCPQPGDGPGGGPETEGSQVKS